MPSIQQGRLESGGYFIVAGISRRQDVVIRRYAESVDTMEPHAIWSDAPYIPEMKSWKHSCSIRFAGFNPS